MSNSDALSPGDVILIYCKFISPQKHKYALCVCPHLPRFFFINSAPRSSKPDAQLRVSTSDLPFLKHDSFVNTGEMVAFSKMDLSTAQWLGHLPERQKTGADRSRFIEPLSHPRAEKNRFGQFLVTRGISPEAWSIRLCDQKWAAYDRERGRRKNRTTGARPDPHSRSPGAFPGAFLFPIAGR